MAGGKTFVLVGHCGADAYSLIRAIGRAVPDAKIIAADDAATLREAITSPAVLLINRVLDGDFAAEDGVALIRSLASKNPKPTMMLISNYADAQEAAVQAGASRGFGKGQLGSPATAELLRSIS